MINVSKTISPVKDNCEAAIVGRKDEDVGMGVKSRFPRSAEVRFLIECNGEFGTGDIGKDEGNVLFKCEIMGVRGGFKELGGLNWDVLGW